MNKAGYIISLIGGVLAILFSVLLVLTGPILFMWGEADDFIADNKVNMGEMWVYLGQYYDVDTFLESDLDDYIEGYVDAFSKVDADALEDMGDEYDIKAFDDVADIYEDFEGYLPNLKLGIIACLAASVIALVGAEIARRFRVAGGVMVLAAAALTLIFSLVANSIIPMAFASLLLILGGVFQIVKPKTKAGAVQGTDGQNGGMPL